MATSYITDFIQSLNAEEIKIVKEYLPIDNSKNKKGKLETLFEILIKDPEKQFTDDLLCKLFQSNSSAIRVLKSRLFDVVKDALTSNKYFENPKIFDQRETIFFNLKKKTLLVKLIFRKTNERKAAALNKLIIEIVEVAAKYQFYDILVEVLTIQKHYSGFRKGISEYEKINNLIVFYDNCYKAVRNANDEYYRVVINQIFGNSLTKKQKIYELQKVINHLEIDYKTTKADEVNYYRHIITLALREFEGKYDQAIIACKKLLVLIENSIVAYSTVRIGFALGNLCLFNVYVGNFEFAIKCAKKAAKYHIPNSMDYTMLKEQEFLVNFYNKTYSAAIKVLNNLLLHSSPDIGNFQASLFKYYEGCVAFAEKKYKNALQLLNNSLEIEKDKTNRNIALRFLLIMTFIELDKKEQAINALQSLRKYIERTNKNQEIKQRDILIFKLFRELEKDNFKRNEKNKKGAALLAELSDKTKPTAWNYFTPELIPFHEWVMTLPVK